ncbi:hypothetical protein P171DRAFT_450118 [Karstenula rhodostoma CBS 690.94]|uniref:BTB domain-containing protein n=1 Tax=Karstenula rhodostoma CBS 690.94 TaxID=1392251 RepID=A0A9P4P4W9_9PLEO|nr:hypothetical protein P171DRAFT_450118 [Karstenula rhodostoma CBS 690.94]
MWGIFATLCDPDIVSDKLGRESCFGALAGPLVGPMEEAVGSKDDQRPISYAKRAQLHASSSVYNIENASWYLHIRMVMQLISLVSFLPGTTTSTISSTPSARAATRRARNLTTLTVPGNWIWVYIAHRKITDSFGLDKMDKTVRIKFRADNQEEQLFTLDGGTLARVSVKFSLIFANSCNIQSVEIEPKDTTLNALVVFESWLRRDKGNNVHVQIGAARERDVCDFGTPETAVHVYALAEDYKIHSLKANVIDYFSRILLLPSDLAGDTVQLIYKKGGDSTLCCSIVQKYAELLHHHNLEKSALMKYPKAFLVDVLGISSKRLQHIDDNDEEDEDIEKEQSDIKVGPLTMTAQSKSDTAAAIPSAAFEEVAVVKIKVVEEVHDENERTIANQHTFTVSKEKITAASPFFAAAFNGPFREAQDGCVELHDTDMETFEEFVVWLDERGGTEKPTVSDAHRQAEYIELGPEIANMAVDLYIFGHVYDVPQLRHDATDRLYSYFFLCDYSNGGSFITPESVDLIYTYTNEISGIRGPWKMISRIIR